MTWRVQNTRLSKKRLAELEQVDMNADGNHRWTFIEILEAACRTAIPFLLVDRVLDIVARAEKIPRPQKCHHQRAFFPSATIPHHPVMPGVLIIEALAQTAAILSFHRRRATSYPTTSRCIYFVGIDGARFKRPVVPGDQLILEGVGSRCEAWPTLSSSRRMRPHQLMDTVVAAEAELMCTDAPGRVN